MKIGKGANAKQIVCGKLNNLDDKITTLNPHQISPGTAIPKPIPSIQNVCSSINFLLINIAPIPPDLLHSHPHLHCQCQGRQSLRPGHPDQSPRLLSHTFKYS